MTPEDQQQVSGVYYQLPVDMLTHAIELTLAIALRMANKGEGRALTTIVVDAALSERVASLVMRDMLRAMVDKTEPTQRDFERLVLACIELANAS